MNYMESKMVISFIIATLVFKPAYGCYTAIFGFGDSVTDTGNHLILSPPDDIPHIGRPPYGETYFGYPTGRCSDGRLIIDFIAEYFGLPLVPPSAGAVKGGINTNGGVNFAVAGAGALDSSFYDKLGIANTRTNLSMKVQLNFFKEMLPSLRGNSSSADFLRSSLFILGTFGSNDYRHALLQGASIDEAWSFVPTVVNAISSAIKELIELGACTIMVPGTMVDGCLASTLSSFVNSSKKEDYDPATGCLVWMNDLVQFHNTLLQNELKRMQKAYPHTFIVYADYFNAAFQLYRFPEKYGFIPRPGCLSACCGGGGPYNFNSSAECGNPAATACADPSSYITWDGYHLTEAGYRLMTIGLVEGPFTSPPLRTRCAHAISI